MDRVISKIWSSSNVTVDGKPKALYYIHMHLQQAFQLATDVGPHPAVNDSNGSLVTAFAVGREHVCTAHGTAHSVGLFALGDVRQYGR